MSQPPQQPWTQPPPQQWGPQAPAPPWGQQPSTVTPTTRGNSALLVLGLVTAVLGLLGACLPSVDFPDGQGWYSPLVQRLGDRSFFQAAGLVLILGIVLLVAGALLQRGRAGVGTGLLLVGSGILAQIGLAQVLGRLQVALDDVGGGSTTAFGGILLMLAGATAVATVVVGLVRLSRLR